MTLDDVVAGAKLAGDGDTLVLVTKDAMPAMTELEIARLNDELRNSGVKAMVVDGTRYDVHIVRATASEQ